ncbi:hypothetical protein HB818_03795 [Listeria booriae]|uniref:hypothetical protein n=1 Tax=Listeria booriae TaxID=1552123 RepID=UPI00162A9D8B|nr:hypothetical protein [Listeria booriae]MBC1284887.1 hypothetical protein [Listeria booriae]
MYAVLHEFNNLEEFYSDIKQVLKEPSALNEDAIMEEVASFAKEYNYERDEYVKKLESEDSKDGQIHRFIFKISNEEGLCIVSYVSHIS